MPVIIDGTLGVNAAAVTTTSWNPTNLNIPGNAVIGDAAADTLTINGSAITLAASGTRVLANSSGNLDTRFGFQNSTTNGNTRVYAFPNGTGNIAGFTTHNSSSDFTNYNEADFAVIGTTDVRISSIASGTNAYLPITVWNGGAERLRIATDGKVGINTSAPETSLQVNGGLTLGTTGSTGTVMRFGTDGANGAIIRADRSDASGVRYLAFGIDYNERMRIDTAGKLLINTTSSTNSISTDKLIVRGDTNGVDLGGSASTGSVRVRGSDTGAALVDFTKLSTNPDASPYFQGRIFYQLGSDYMSFHTASSERLRIDSSGRTMIGMNNGQSTFNAYNANGGAPATSGSTDSTTVASLINGVVGIDFGHYTNGTAWIQNRTFNNYATNYDLTLQPNGGNVGIGTSAQSAKLSVFGSAGRFSELLGNTIQVRIAASEGGWNSLIGFANNSGTFLGGVLGNGVGQAISDIRIGPGSTPGAVVIDTNGTVTLSQGQLKFPATQNASSDANTLDDYEEGTFTPMIGVEGGSANLSPTTTYSVGYTKVGRLVHVWATVYYANVTANGGGTIGAVLFANMPFPISKLAGVTTGEALLCPVILESTSNTGMNNVGYMRTFYTGGGAGSTGGYLYYNAGTFTAPGGGYLRVGGSPLNNGSGLTVSFNFSYFTS